MPPRAVATGRVLLEWAQGKPERFWAAVTCDPDDVDAQAVTLIELLVVLAIVALLIGLLIPAVQYSRERARMATCASNVRQLAFATSQFIETRKEFPQPCPDGKMGGWAIAILPFMEEVQLADHLTGNPAFDPASPNTYARCRPAIMTCPSALESESDSTAVPPSHYTAYFDRGRKVRQARWQIGDARTDARFPWVTSHEAEVGGPAELCPHSVYTSVSGNGPTINGLWFIDPK